MQVTEKFTSDQSIIYRNAMESLVVEEVDRQFCRLPSRLADHLSHSEVIAYALNRLPPLYATSEKGWRQQRLRGKSELGTQIHNAVRQGLVAVQRDPLRMATPLQFPEELEPQQALTGLKELLGAKRLDWTNLVDVVKYSLAEAGRVAVANHQNRQDYDWQDKRYTF
jgi:Late competence development protein ComFB